MSLAIRSYTEYIINKIQEEGVKSPSYHSAEEIESDLIDIIWNAYEKWEGDK